MLPSKNIKSNIYSGSRFKGSRFKVRERYISPGEFKMSMSRPDEDLPCQWTLTGRAAVRSFINYFKKYEERKSKIPDFERGRPTLNHEP